MDRLRDLKNTLCRELEEYADHDSVDMGTLEIVDKLAHAIKNIEKIIEHKDGYSERRYRYDDGTSYRGRKRDSMGRYSSEGMVDELRSLAADADDRTRREIMRMIEKM